MAPELISFAGGGNDVLRRGFDPVSMLARFEEVVARLRATGADVLLFRFADVTRRLPGRRFILPRVEVLNRAVGEVADKHGAMLVDLWHDEEFHNPRTVERGPAAPLHGRPSPGRRPRARHPRAGGRPRAGCAVRTRRTRRTWIAARARDARWARQHLAPWVRRRLAGRSSGDTLTAKRPTLGPARRLTDLVVGAAEAVRMGAC